jgi:GNAT superfamily N-acetyltransferase
MDIKIRKAKLDDLDELISMGQALYEGEKQFEPLLTFSVQDAREHYTKQLENKNACFLIAEDTSQILGYLYGHINIVDYFSTTSPEAEAEVIYLKPETRGKGIAKQLVDEFIIWAKGKKAFRVKGGIYEQNEPSKNLFLKYGFKPYHTVYTLDLDN